MASLRYNKPSPLTIEYINGGPQTITLNPGVNIGIEESELTALKTHPIVLALIEEDILEVLIKDPVKTAELQGFKVTQDRKTDEPIPVQPAIKGGLKATATEAVTKAIAKEQEKSAA